MNWKIVRMRFLSTVFVLLGVIDDVAHECGVTSAALVP